MQIDVTLDSRGYLPDRFAKYASELYKGVPTCSFPFSVSGLPLNQIGRASCRERV